MSLTCFRSSPVRIETEFAIYILQEPHEEYKALFHDFFLPRRVAQIVVTSLQRDRRVTYEDWLRSFKRHIHPFGEMFREHDVFVSVLGLF